MLPALHGTSRKSFHASQKQSCTTSTKSIKSAGGGVCTEEGIAGAPEGIPTKGDMTADAREKRAG
jgi:hypothetical protein